MKTLFIIIAASIMAASCSAIAFQRLMDIHKGMSIEDVSTILESGDYPDEGIMIISDLKTDTFDFSDAVPGNDKVMVIVTQKYDPIQDGDDAPYYIFAFVNGELNYWGMPVEFSRSDDFIRAAIGEHAIQILVENYIEE